MVFERSLFRSPDGNGHFYCAAGPAVEFVLARKTIAEAISEVAQSTFEFLDWQTQLEMIQSIFAVEKEFGKLDPEAGDLMVANDWLKDRGMEPLVFPESIEATLGRITTDHE